MWKNQGSWNFFHAKLIPNSSIKVDEENKDIQHNNGMGSLSIPSITCCM